MTDAQAKALVEQTLERIAGSWPHLKNRPVLTGLLRESITLALQQARRDGEADGMKTVQDIWWNYVGTKEDCYFYIESRIEEIANQRAQEGGG